MSESTEIMKELEALQPNQIEVKVGGETIVVKPFKFKQLLQALRYLSEMTENMGFMDELGIFRLIAAHPEQVMGLIKLATDKPDSFFDDLEAEEGVDIALAVWKVNSDFFSQKLGPKMEKIMPSQNSQSDQTKTTEETKPESPLVN